MAEPLPCVISVRPRLRVGEPVELLFREVTRDGTALDYQGMMKKRAPPDATSYIKLAPGASVEAKVELSSAYDFSVPGKYTLAFPGPLMDVATKKADVPHPFGESRPREVRCTPAELTIVAD